MELLRDYSNTDSLVELEYVLDSQAREAWTHRSDPPRLEPRRYAPDERTKVIERYRTGMSATAIGRELSMPKSSVNYVLKTAGIGPRRRGRSTS